MLKAIVRQWPELNKKVAFFPGTGYKNLLTPKQAAELSSTLGNKFKVLIHRDRDSLSDAEVANLEAAYLAVGASIWLPVESDVEAYFCGADFISAHCGIPLAVAQNHIGVILNREAVPIGQQFASQRSVHNQEFYSAGGSPNNATVWAAFQQRPLKGAKGKFIYKQLKNALANNYTDQSILSSSALTGNVAPDLKVKLESLV